MVFFGRTEQSAAAWAAPGPGSGGHLREGCDRMISEEELGLIAGQMEEKASREFQKYITKAAMENIFLPKVNHSSAGAQILLEVCRSYSDMSE